MIPTQRSSLVLLRNAALDQPTHGPGLGITRIDKGGVAAALDKYLRGIDVGVHKQGLTQTLWPAISGIVCGRHVAVGGGQGGARPGSRPDRQGRRFP